jgi:hypothetical protein
VGIPLLLKAAMTRKVGFIYERYSLFNFTGVLVARLRRVPIVLEVNSPFALEQSRDREIRLRRFAEWTERAICNMADHVIVVSTPLARMMAGAGVMPSLIEVMPNGYDTFVGEGSGLSGGQMQRIALARAFVRNPEILMLDEATRALDARLHNLVLENVDREFSDSTRIMITHATNDAKTADQVIYLEKGEIKEQGTYDDLLKKRGAFAAMVDAERGRELTEESA